MAFNKPIKVGVVGAGIAGLSAAIALRKAGHDVEVFERSEFKSEWGAAVAITPNGSKVLEHWGIDPLEARGVKCQGSRELVSMNLNETSRTSDAHVRATYGADRWLFHRADLHGVLKNYATLGATPDGMPVLSLGTPVIDIDPIEGTMKMADSTKIQKDLIIVADGIRSYLLSKTFPSSPPLELNGQSILRGLVSFATLGTHPTLHKLVPKLKEGMTKIVNPLDKRFVMIVYPCRSRTLLNMAILHPTPAKYSESEDWHARATVDEAYELLENFHQDMKTMWSYAADIRRYTAFRRDPIPQLSRGKTILIGDACAPAVPNMGQGATRAIECAGALQILFSDMGPLRNEMEKTKIVLERVQWYEELMKPHVHASQLLAEHRPGNPESDERLRTRLANQTIPSFKLQRYAADLQHHFWSYDALREARLFVEQRRLEKVSAALLEILPARRKLAKRPGSREKSPPDSPGRTHFSLSRLLGRV